MVVIMKKRITDHKYFALVVTMAAVLALTGVLPVMHVQASGSKTDTMGYTVTDMNMTMYATGIVSVRRGACAVYEYNGYIYGVENFTY